MNEPLKEDVTDLGMPNGLHTPEGQRKLIGFLAEKTGLKFEPHGSVGGGRTSENDMDIMEVPQSEEEQEAAYHEDMRRQGEIWERAKRREISKEEAMRQIYGDDPAGTSNPVDQAMAQLGFKPTKIMNFGGYAVIRYRNDKTGHTIELWMEGDPDSAIPGRGWSEQDLE